MRRKGKEDDGRDVSEALSRESEGEPNGEEEQKEDEREGERFSWKGSSCKQTEKANR